MKYINENNFTVLIIKMLYTKPLNGLIYPFAFVYFLSDRGKKRAGKERKTASLA